MATINETISKGNKYRRLKDATSKIWQRISFWTAASDVEFENGSTLEESMGDIKGITDDLTSNSSDVAASAAAVYALNSKIATLTEQITSFSGSLSDLYNAFVEKGVTPTEKTLAACVDAVNELYTSGYTAGYADSEANKFGPITLGAGNSDTNWSTSITAGTINWQFTGKSYEEYTRSQFTIRVNGATYASGGWTDQGNHSASGSFEAPKGTLSVWMANGSNHDMYWSEMYLWR